MDASQPIFFGITMSIRVAQVRISATDNLHATWKSVSPRLCLLLSFSECGVSSVVFPLSSEAPRRTVATQQDITVSDPFNLLGSSCVESFQKCSGTYSPYGYNSPVKGKHAYLCPCDWNSPSVSQRLHYQYKFFQHRREQHPETTHRPLKDRRIRCGLTINRAPHDPCGAT